MKKYLIWMIIICFIVSTMFVVSACKTETAEETTEETAEETTEETAEETVEEIEEITSEPITLNMWANAGPEFTLFTAASELYMSEHPNVTMMDKSIIIQLL